MKINRTQKSEVTKKLSLKARLDGLQRSLFGKYFLACASVILISFVGLAIALIILSIRFSNNQKQELYLKNAGIISNYEFIYRNDRTGIMDVLLQLVYYSIDADKIYLIDTQGYVNDGMSTKEGVVSMQNAISPDIVKILESGRNYEETGTLSGFYTQPYITAAVPIVDHGTYLGAIMISSKAGGMTSYLRDIFRIFIVCIAIVLVFAFLAIYFITLRLVKPLRQMSSAAKSFAKGDFSIRVPVYEKDEVGQLAVSFNNMAASLASLEGMRRSFVANVSHELKTPMTSIAGFIDGILDGTIPAEKQEHYLKIVSDEVKRLSRLVRSFLDIARIEAGELKINPTAFDIEETLRRVIVGFEYAINEKELTVKGLDDSDRQLMVQADPDIIHQIIYNLVDNAVKFANKGGYIELNVATIDQKVFVGVKNSGMGIPKQDLPYVFDRFYKTDKSRSFDRKGVGLGLYIVKSELNVQGEDIVVKSVEGESCEFVFTLTKA